MPRRLAGVLAAIVAFAAVGAGDASAYTAWSTRPPMPEVGWPVAFQPAGGRIVAWSVDQDNPHVYTYTVRTNSWHRRAPLPRGLWGVGSASVDGVVYSIGGLSPVTFKASRSVWAYNVAGNHWAKRAPLPQKRWIVKTAVVDGDIFAVGLDSQSNPTHKLYRYHPPTDTWTVEAVTPRALDDGFTAAAIDGTIYFAGPIEGGAQIGDVLTYTPATGRWGAIKPMPRPRYYASAVAGADGRLYVIGGIKNGLESSAVDVYNPVTGRWDRGPDLETRRAHIGTALGPDGTIYAVGGTQKHGAGACGCASDVLEALT